MRTLTREEIQKSMDHVHDMSEEETLEFMAQMQKEQPYIQIYAAAICERGDFENENDSDAFVNLVSVIWHAMRQAAGVPLTEVLGTEIDEREEKMMGLYEYAAGEPEPDWPAMLQTWMEDYPQRPLLEFILAALMSPENSYGVTAEGSGMIFTYLKIITDCLNHAEPIQEA